MNTFSYGTPQVAASVLRIQEERSLHNKTGTDGLAESSNKNWKDTEKKTKSNVVRITLCHRKMK